MKKIIYLLMFVILSFFVIASSPAPTDIGDYTLVPVPDALFNWDNSDDNSTAVYNSVIGYFAGTKGGADGDEILPSQTGFGNSFYSDGSGVNSEYIDINSTPVGTSNFSYCFWTYFITDTNSYDFCFNDDGGNNFHCSRLTATTEIFATVFSGVLEHTNLASTMISLNEWVHVCFVRNVPDNVSYYYNGELNTSEDIISVKIWLSTSRLNGKSWATDSGANVYYDDLLYWYDDALTPAEIKNVYDGDFGKLNYSRPTISNINLTSGNDAGDITDPYSTNDSTPTFDFNTDIDSDCRIADENYNYTDMGVDRNCTVGEGSKKHACTLSAADALTYTINNDTSFISCVNILTLNQSINSTSGILNVSVDSELTLTLVSPNDNALPASEMYFNCSAKSNTNLTNISLYMTDGSDADWKLNQTSSVGGLRNSTNWTMDLASGTYTWGCTTWDIGSYTVTSGNRTIATLTINAYIDGVNTSEKYEFGTSVNISVSGSSTEVCISIDDNVNNVSIGNQNFTCGTVPFYTYYNITTLRINEFNDTSISLNAENNDRLGISIDNRTELVRFRFNISSDSADYLLINTSLIVVIIPGELIRQQEFTSKFIVSDVYYSEVNLTYSSASSITVYFNVSSQGNFTERSGIFNFSLTGFSLDVGNEFNNLHEFNNFSLIPQGNVSNGTREFEVYENAITNNTEVFDKFNGTLWVGDTIERIGIGDFGGSSTYEKCNSYSPTGTDYSNCVYAYRQTPHNTANDSYFYINEIDLRHTGAFSMELGLYSYTDFESGPIRPKTHTSLIFYDLTNELNLFTCTIEGLASALDGSPIPVAADCYLNISGQKNEDGDWFIMYSYHEIDERLGVSSARYNQTISVSTLDSNVPYRIAFKGWNQNEVVGDNDDRNYVRIKSISISGISLNRTLGYYSNNGTYTSEILNQTTNDISAMKLNATTVLNSGQVSYFLSNNNGSDWEAVTNGETHKFTSTGKTAKFLVIFNTTNNYTSPIITKYRVQVIPEQLEGLTVKVGNNETSMIIGVLNSTTSPIYFNGSDKDLNSYLNDLGCAPVDLTCLVPVTFTSDSGGILQLSNLNLSQDVNPVNIDFDISNLETLKNVELHFNYSGDNVTVSDLKLDFFGNKNISIFVFVTSNYEVNQSLNFTVRYSKFNLTLPDNVDYWEVFASTKDDRNITPYGQTNSIPIWNVTSLAYSDPFDLYIKTNKTLNTCLNITYSNTSTKSNLRLNTSSQIICPGVDVAGECNIWNFIDLNDCTNRFEIPYMFFSAICESCIITSDFDKTNLLIE